MGTIRARKRKMTAAEPYAGAALPNSMTVFEREVKILKSLYDFGVKNHTGSSRERNEVLQELLRLRGSFEDYLDRWSAIAPMEQAKDANRIGEICLHKALDSVCLILKTIGHKDAGSRHLYSGKVAPALLADQQDLSYQRLEMNLAILMETARFVKALDIEPAARSN